MGGFEEYKPAMAMLGLQFLYAGVSISSRASLVQGMSPRVFIVYRQAIATLATAPFAYFSRRKSGRRSLDLRSFTLMFLISLIGVTINQNLYFEGLYLASSSMGSAMGNLVPAITFVMASIIGFEKVNIRSIRSIAKIIGTVFCVMGAISMSLLRGPKLLNAESVLPVAKSLFGSDSETQNHWLLGCLFLFGSSCCWSLWLILQVPVSAIFPDHLSLSAWMCFFGTLQSAAVTLFIEKDPNEWIFHSYLEFASCFYAGIVASALAFFVQSWCVSKRGPLFSALFNPLCTVVVTILAALFLHEDIYTGSLIGGICVVIGLYIVLWGKARDFEKIKDQTDERSQDDQTSDVKISIDESSDKMSCKIDLEEPLLLKDYKPQ